MILNIYKPTTWTSFDVVAKIRSLLHVKKVGHAGTLDPLAEGVLLVLTDEDTKKQTELMNHTKEYVADISFGATSESYDLETDIMLNDTLPTINELQQKLPNLLKSYLGVITQTVPPYSAKKVAGKPLYKLARKRQLDTTTLPVQQVEILKFETLSIFTKELNQHNKNFNLPTARLKITCSKGTYIRSLAHDLGKGMGCGAVLTSLLRTKIGDYTVEDAIKLENLSPAVLKP